MRESRILQNRENRAKYRESSKIVDFPPVRYRNIPMANRMEYPMEYPMEYRNIPMENRMAYPMEYPMEYRTIPMENRMGYPMEYPNPLSKNKTRSGPPLKFPETLGPGFAKPTGPKTKLGRDLPASFPKVWVLEVRNIPMENRMESGGIGGAAAERVCKILPILIKSINRA